MNKDGQLNENSTKQEIERRFINDSKVFDDLCIAFRGETWAERDKAFLDAIAGFGGKKEEDDGTEKRR